MLMIESSYAKRRIASSVLILWMSGVLTCTAAIAGTPGTYEVPIPSANWLGNGSASHSQAGSTLTIQQNSNKVILNWDRFNIGPKAAVIFNQPGPSAMALNRIWSADPSVIQGQLSANGQVYLINQNGILFDHGAQINVHTLVASALNITDDVFMKGIDTFIDGSAQFDGGLPGGFVRVEEGAQLHSATGGKIMLLAPDVQNNGLITTTDGQTILAAGSKVYLATTDADPTLSNNLRGFLVEVDNGGTTTNMNLGEIVAARGNVTLVGLAVNQQGRISATTSVNSNGSIRLLARDTVKVTLRPADPNGAADFAATKTGAVTLGSGSITEVLPELNDPVAIVDEQQVNPSLVEVVGGAVHMQGGSRIVAPGGTVTLNALENPQTLKTFGSPVSAPGAAKNGSRVLLDSGSLIDVSGTKNVEIPIERNLVQVDLRGDVVKDSPLLWDSPLYGETVTVDISKGTPLADYSGFEKAIKRTVAERTAAGGSVKVSSEGDIIMQGNATIDVSGGSLRYLDGYLNTTQLVSQGKVVDISQATPDRIYDGIVGQIVRTHDKWGREATETWYAPSNQYFASGYIEGKNAGTVQFTAPAMVIDGNIFGKKIAGTYQRQPYSVDLSSAPYKILHTLAPNGSSLIIGDSLAEGSAPDYKTPDVEFVASRSSLPSDFGVTSTLPENRANHVQLATSLVGKDGVENLAVYSNGKIELPAGTALTSPGGSVKLVGAEVNVAGDIVTQSGKITLQAREVFGANPSSSSVVVNGFLNASGGWVNDYTSIDGKTGGDFITESLLIKGGKIEITARGNVSLHAQSVLDVSGGGWVNSSEKLAGKGDAGSIAIASGEGAPNSATDFNDSILHLGGKLSGYALAKGGELKLTTGKVRIGGVGEAGELALATDFFTQGGFLNYSVTGVDALTVAAGKKIEVNAENLVLDGTSFKSVASGTSMATFTQHKLLEQPLRKAANISLTAKSIYHGDLQLEQGATIHTDPGSIVSLNSGRQMTINGTVDAPAGKINLTLTAVAGSPEDQDPATGFISTQSIWLGDAAQLLSKGFDQTLLKDNGMRQGEVLSGGEITIKANKGYVVTESGSVMDVSGHAMKDAAGNDVKVDVLQQTASGSNYVPLAVKGDAGSISIETREGALLDGAMIGRAGGDGAQGGQFSLKVDTKVYNENDKPINTNNPYPDSKRQVIVSQGGGFVPAGLTAGEIIDTSRYNGNAFVAANNLKAGGFSQITLQAKDVIRFDGNVSLQTDRSVRLDAPTIAASSGATVDLHTRYLSIGNGDAHYQVVPGPQVGAASLTTHSDWLDLEGNVSLDGFAKTRFVSSGDIRLKGVWDLNNPSLSGSFTTAGDLTMIARQIYPSTYSNFILAIQNNPAGIFHIAANGTDSPVLSAAGKLTINAPNIMQEGVIKAPLGELSLNADNALTIAANSVTSVSAEGQIIPFGKTSGGTDWVYELNYLTNTPGVKTIAAVPEKKISISGKDVNIDPNAKVDISGGGDLYAYEFIPGPPTLSTDPLAAENTYAILPGLNSSYAPYDNQYYSGSNVKPGDSVYLSGADGLPAGSYTLLPARYAMLPGAFVVKAVKGFRDMQPQQRFVRADGTNVVAGYLSVPGLTNDAARFSGFEVRSGAALKKDAEYIESNANHFFTNKALISETAIPRLPIDAGQLMLSIGNSLSLNGKPLKAASEGGRGAIVDIVAQKLAIGTGSNRREGYVNIDAAALTNLEAESLLLGGVRSTSTDGQEIRVGANDFVISNSAESVLKAPEVILASKDKLTVEKGSVIEGVGTIGVAQNLIVGRDGNGDGALVRVAANGYAEIKRENLTPQVDMTHGILNVQENVLLRGKSIALDSTLDTFSKAALQLAGGSLSLAAGKINLGEAGDLANGLSLPNTLLASLGNLDSLYLKSYSTIDAYADVSIGGNVAMPTINHLSVEAAAVRGFNNAGKVATLVAGDIEFHNRSGFINTSAGTGTGSLRMEAQRSVTMGEGDKEISGFANVAIVTDGKIVGRGQGTEDKPAKLHVTGDLTLQAARVTGSSGSNQNWTADGAVQISKPVTPTNLASATQIGAHLEIDGKRIDHQGNIELPAGVVKLTANGSGVDDNVTLAAGSSINVAGVEKTFADVSVFASGGEVNLTSKHGNVIAQAATVVDVSGAQNGGNAGSVSVSAIEGEAKLLGTLKGKAISTARQGGYTQDTKILPSFSTLNNVLESSGFDESRNIRVRQGNVEIAQADKVNAHRFVLAADAGKIDVNGTVEASGNKGGEVLLAARDDVTLYANSSVKAKGLSGHGGKVELGTVSGQISAEEGSQVDVSGAPGNDGGKVVFRAANTGNEIAVNLGSGVVTGAKEVIAEAFKVYSDIFLPSVNTDLNNLMASASVIEARLGNNVQLRPGIEIASISDISVNSILDLSSTSWKVDSRPVMLTLRTAGNLNINKTISDGFVKNGTNSATSSGAALGTGTSANYRLIAGADLSGANLMSLTDSDNLVSGQGNVKIANDTIVRTGTGSIAIAAGGNVTMSNAGSVIYTAGEKASELSDAAPSDFTKNYAKNGGDISISAQGDIKGVQSDQLITDWLYRKGDGANNKTSWWVQYDKFKQGIGTLGGGDLALDAGGNIDNVSAVLPTTGRVIGKDPDTAIVDIQGGGNLHVHAGNDIRSGVYYVARGHGELSAGGGIVSGYRNKSNIPIHTVLAMGDGDFKLSAFNNLQLETVMNPTMFLQSDKQSLGIFSNNPKDKSYFFTYTPDSKVSLLSLAGNVILNNSALELARTLPSAQFTKVSNSADDKNALVIYPAIVEAAAMGGSISVNGPFALFPSSQGNLNLLAANGIETGTINMSDADPKLLPSMVNPVWKYSTNATFLGSTLPHATTLQHNKENGGNTSPVRIVAQSGDLIAKGQYNFPKQALLIAGRDMVDIDLRGQNANANDVTLLRAERDITYNVPRKADNTLDLNDKSIELGGSGRLMLSAGRNVNLGNAFGVVTIGNKKNIALPNIGADVVVMAGVPQKPDYQGFAGKYGLDSEERYSTDLSQSFFGTLRNAGRETRYKDGYDAIAALFPAQNYKGDLNMYFSQIKTEQGGNIDLYVPGGAINAGLASIPLDLYIAKGAAGVKDGIEVANPSILAGKTGVVTMKGGSVRSVSKGDFLVNSSRVFTLLGGDILLWSSEGNIDAGKGAKTAISVPPPIVRTVNGVTVVETQGAATGSGIRVLLTGNAVPGDVDLIAPHGEVNAGDAGIGSAGNVNIAAIRVVGGDNIQAAGSTSGVPVANTSSPSAGMTGLNNVADAGKAGSDATKSLGDAARSTQEIYKPSFLNVEVIGLGE